MDSSAPNETTMEKVLNRPFVNPVKYEFTPLETEKTCAKVGQSIQKFGCWMPPVSKYPRREVEIRNRKYCKIYPISHECRRPLPRLKECTSEYSKWDYILESITHEQVLLISEAFQKYITLLALSKMAQWKMANRVCDLSFRYKHLTRGICVKIYPEIVSAPVEKKTLIEFANLREKIEQSNSRLNKEFKEIADLIAELEKRFKRLDTTHHSIFLEGNDKVPSYYQVRQVIDDTYDYFNSMLAKMKHGARLLQAKDAEACLSYRSMVIPNKTEPFEIMDLGNKCHNLVVRIVKCPHCNLQVSVSRVGNYENFTC